MGWKSLPAWIKGGIYGIIFGVILTVLALISAPLALPNYITLLVLWLAKPFLYFSKIITGCYSGEECVWQVYIAVPIALILEGLVIGMFVGWIVGKVKRKL